MLPAALTFAIAIEAALLAGATAWFGDPGRALVPLVPLVLALWIAALLLRLCEEVAWLRRLDRVVLIGGILVTALLFIRPHVFGDIAAGNWGWVSAFNDITNIYAEQPHTDVGMLFLSILVWLMAERMVRNAGDYEQRRASFLRLFVVLVVAILVGVWSANGNDRLSIALALMLPLYAVCGLLMMGQVRLSDIRARMQRACMADRRALRIWNLTALGLIVATVGLLFAAVALFYGDAYLQALQTLSGVWNTLLDIVALLLAWLTAPFVLLLTNLFGPRKTPTRSPGGGGGGGIQPPPLGDAVNHAIYSGILIAVILIVALFLLLRVRWQRGDPFEEDYEEFREALPSRERLRGSRRALVGIVGDPAPPGSVRAVYRDVLRRGEQVGLGREDDETATEYAARLAPLLEIAEGDASVPAAAEDLTRSYEAERYGAATPTPERVTRARSAAQRIIAILNGVKKPKGGRADD